MKLGDLFEDNSDEEEESKQPVNYSIQKEDMIADCLTDYFNDSDQEEEREEEEIK